MRFHLCGLLLGILFLASPSQADADFQKTKIAILDFQVVGEKYGTANMGEVVAEWLITGLVETGRFDVIERRLLQKVLEEQKIGATGIIDKESVAQLGKLLGVKAVVTGTVLTLGGVIEVNARLISIETGSIIAAQKIKADSPAKLSKPISQIVTALVQAFPIQGYVVQRENSSVTIDLGSPNGVTEGMKFIVYKEGEVLKHPKTGEILDIETIDLGEIEIKEVRGKTSKGVVTEEESSGAIKSGLMVKSIPTEVAAVEEKEPVYEETQKAMVETDGFLFEVKECKLSGMTLECRVTITNKTPIKKAILVYGNDSRITDDANKEYRTSDVMLGGRRAGRGGVLKWKFYPGGYADLVLRFSGISDSIGAIKSLELSCLSKPRGYFKVQIGEIYIPR